MIGVLWYRTLCSYICNFWELGGSKNGLHNSLEGGLGYYSFDEGKGQDPYTTGGSPRSWCGFGCCLGDRRGSAEKGAGMCARVCTCAVP